MFWLPSYFARPMNAFSSVPCWNQWKVASLVWFLRSMAIGSVSIIGVLFRCWRLTTRFFLKLLPPVCQKVLSFIIHPDQRCSIPGCSIFSNVTLLRDTLDYIECTNETAILVSLDQEKAFDRVNRSFLLDLLVVVGFGLDFCRWIATLYNGAYMRIILNNWLTERISLERGVLVSIALCVMHWGFGQSNPGFSED